MKKFTMILKFNALKIVLKILLLPMSQIIVAQNLITSSENIANIESQI